LSNNKYDGIIGLSQGAAMAALLVCMVRSHSLTTGQANCKNSSMIVKLSLVSLRRKNRTLGLGFSLPVSILVLHADAHICIQISDTHESRIRLKQGASSLYICRYSEYSNVTQLVPSLINGPNLVLSLLYYSLAIDLNDPIVPSQKTIALQKLFPNSKLLSHNEGRPTILFEGRRHLDDDRC